MNQTDHPAAGPRPRIAPGRGLHAARWMWMLAAFLLAACSGDGTGPPPPPVPVEAVTLAGAPDDVVLAGTTVQLTATVVGASGIILSDRPVTWQSSDAAIATVSATGAVSVVGMGSVTITASAEGKQASATLDARAGGQLGPLGGTLRLLDGKITVTAPQGSFQFPTMLLFRPAVSAPPDPRSVPGTAFEMEPYVLSASPPPSLTLAYDPTRLPAGVTEAGLQLYRVVDGQWRVVPGSVADTERKTVRGVVFAGGTYAVAAAAPSTVAIDGALVGGAVYVGQTRPLQAAPLDVRGDTLRGRTITWSTSDPGRATVDAAGNVTGQGAGTATITATVEGVQGVVTVTVLARPVASWGGAEWTTLQGNARHDGHVAATLDPISFRELWAKPTGDFPRQVATGSGRVFISTGIFSPKQLTAFDAATGAVSWTRTFSPAELISSPAYANGRVYVLVSGPNAALWAFDAVDGTVRFTEPYADRHFSVSAPVVVSGGVYLGGRSGSGGAVYRLDALTGEEVWQAPLPGGDGQSPAVADGRVLAFSMTGLHDDSDLTAVDAADGSVESTVSTSIQVVGGTPVLGGAGNVLATTGGQLASIRLLNGNLAWSMPGSFGTYPAVGDGVVYASRASDVVAVRESDGSLLWTWTPKRGVPWGPPLVTDNLLFISTQVVGPGGVPQYVTDAIDLATGKQVWSYPAGGFLAMGADGTLFIAANGTLTSSGTYSNGTLTAIDVR
jgi:outer membrane protein assembly factor BamB